MSLINDITLVLYLTKKAGINRICENDFHALAFRMNRIFGLFDEAIFYMSATGIESQHIQNSIESMKSTVKANVVYSSVPDIYYSLTESGDDEALKIITKKERSKRWILQEEQLIDMIKELRNNSEEFSKVNNLMISTE